MQLFLHKKLGTNLNNMCSPNPKATTITRGHFILVKTVDNEKFTDIMTFYIQ